jgi:hypothetical protein
VSRNLTQKGHAQIEWLPTRVIADPLGGGLGAAVLGPGDHDPVSGLTGPGSGQTGQTPVGRSAWVSRPELSEDWLELGETGPQSG